MFILILHYWLSWLLKVQVTISKNQTATGWLSGKRVRPPCGKSQVHAPAGSYQKP